MKKAVRILLLTLIVSVVSSCKEKAEKTSPKNEQMTKVMAIHDEVMPKMSVLGNLIGELSSKEDSTTSGERYQNASKDLQAAHKAMMDWMQGFGKRFDPDEILNGKALTSQKQLWLNEEEEKVKALRDQINSSIKMAEELLAKE